MNRLTERLENGVIKRVEVSDDNRGGSVMARLAAYEDILFGADDSSKQISLDRLTEICEAERDGRCVVLPCKVGDTVHLIARGYVEELKVRTFFVGHPSYNRGEPDPRYEMVRLTNADVPLKDFGKTVFLTHPEAEAALAQKGEK